MNLGLFLFLVFVKNGNRNTLCLVVKFSVGYFCKFYDNNNRCKMQKMAQVDNAGGCNWMQKCISKVVNGKTKIYFLQRLNNCENKGNLLSFRLKK